MKKKAIVFVIAASVVMTALILLLSGGKSILTGNVEITTVTTRNFTSIYKTTGTVDSGRHACYFIGYVGKCDLEEGMYVSSGSLLVRYKDFSGTVIDLNSPVNGFVTEIGTDRIVVSDTDYHVVSRLPQQQVQYLKTGDEAVFSVNDRRYLLTVSQISSYGILSNGTVTYEVIFTVDDAEGLKLNQQGNVILHLENYGSVPVVDRRAVLNDEKGSYLLKREWLDDPANDEEYRIDIRIVAVNETDACVSGIGLEGAEVCILSEELKELLNDQPD